MLQLPVLGVRRLGVIVLLAGASCSAPDSSGLFGPAASAPLDGETSSADDAPAAPAADDAANDSDPAVSAPAPAPELPGVSIGEGPPASGGLIPPETSAGDGASVPVTLPADAGVPLGEPEPEPEPKPEPEPELPDAGAASPEPSGSPESPTSPEPSEPSEPAECGGAVALGQCWYVGARNQSCDAVCATRGGVAPASIAVIGTPEQGGSLAGCDAVVQALGGPAGVVNEGYREDELGFGCHVFIDGDGATSAWWLTAPAYSPSVSAPSVQPLCGCVR